MNQLSKIEQSQSKLKTLLYHVLDFIFSFAIGITGLVVLAGYVLTGMSVYLKIASLLSLLVILIFSITTIFSLFKFGFDSFIVEMEVKFFDVSLYSTFIFITFLFQFLELFRYVE
jgi:hypothetical protein